MKKVFVLAAAIVLLGLGGIAQATASEYQIVTLGSISGESVGAAWAINDAGTIVGEAYVGGLRAAVWRNGVGELMGGISGGAYGINTGGAIVGVNRLGDGYGFVYSGYIMHNLGNMTAPDAINDAGWVAGSKGRDGFGYSASAWTPDGTIIDLGNGSQACDVNSSLQLVGTATWAAVRWTVDPLTLAVSHDFYHELYAGANSGMAYAINDNGVAVGRSGGRPVIWTSIDAAPIDILSGYSSLFSGEARGINAAGQVVGQVVSNVGGVQKTSAFLWDSAHGLSFLPDFGNASRAYGINNLGQIVGQACKEDYFPVLWEPVPEPSSIICLAGGLVGLLEIRRRWAR